MEIQRSDALRTASTRRRPVITFDLGGLGDLGLGALALWLCTAAGAAAAPCGTPITIACGQTVQHSLSGCFIGGNWYDLWTFQGSPVGQTAVVRVSSPQFAPLVEMFDPGDTRVALMSTDLLPPDGGDATVKLQAVIGPSDGTWHLGVTTEGFFEPGPYTLSFTCIGASATCAQDSQALCLDTGRFRISATYDDGHGDSGSATAVPLGDDIGYLWFFSPANVEVVVKVVDGCALNGRYWFFAGGLTNVDTVITVTDTATGATRQYRNPAGETFSPVQDTSAFATCP